jgi:hypothetical protein
MAQRAGGDGAKSDLRWRKERPALAQRATWAGAKSGLSGHHPMLATPHPNTVLHPISTPNISTTTTAMDRAIEYPKSFEGGHKFWFEEMAKKWGVVQCDSPPTMTVRRTARPRPCPHMPPQRARVRRWTQFRSRSTDLPYLARLPPHRTLIPT